MYREMSRLCETENIKVLLRASKLSSKLFPKNPFYGYISLFLY